MKRLLAGCGVYLQGEDILEQIGSALLARGCRNGLWITGQRAFAAVEDRLAPTVMQLGMQFSPRFFAGHCTDEEIEAYTCEVQTAQADCVVGMGGGKVLDLAKAVAEKVGLPVFCVPTTASTCAAFAPLSVVYHPNGTQKDIRFFTKEVDGVFVDTKVIAAAPARLLAAGLADAMAKACEYATMLPGVFYGTLPMGKYMGYRLALAGDEVIAACASDAVKSVEEKRVTEALEDAVFCAIACTGIVSGLGGFGGRGGARFAIAHAFNEVLRGTALPVEKWLHGEVVAVGILAQMAANGDTPEKIAARRALFEHMGIPCTLSSLSPSLVGEGLEKFTNQIFKRIEVPDFQQEILRQAIRSVA